MSGHQVRGPMLSDDQIRLALRPGPDLSAPANFGANLRAAIAGTGQRRGLLWFGTPSRAPALRLVGQVLFLVALLLVLLIGAIVVGALRDRPTGGGPLFVAQANELSLIDAQTGEITVVASSADGISGVARSMGGSRVTFWTGAANDDLELVAWDGSDRRRLATNILPAPSFGGGIDVWGGNDQYVASGVTSAGEKRILVVNVETGDGVVIGPADGADSPLFSPHGDWVAFVHGTTVRRLAIMRLDGSERRDISGGLDASVSGPDNWSSDGRWIYFDAVPTGGLNHNVYRIDVESGEWEQLTTGQEAAAPALSPDDGTVAFMVWVQARNGTNGSVWVMTADGSHPTLLEQDADLGGWSTDSQHVLVVSHLPDGSAQLVAIAPSSRERRVLLSVDSCATPCLQSLSWGWPRP